MNKIVGLEKKNYLRVIIISLYVCKCVCLFDNGKFILIECDGNCLIVFLRMNDILN